MKNVKAVLAIKFKTTLNEEELVRTINSTVPGYKNVPGLVEKYFLSEEGSDLISGIYIFSTVSAREVFWESAFAKDSIPRYGVVADSVRIERYAIDLVLTDTV